MEENMAKEIRKYLTDLNHTFNSSSEMHFVNYTRDTNFEKYFKALNFILSQSIQLNIFNVNKQETKQLKSEMTVIISSVSIVLIFKV